jgi:hypothetical protein
MKTVAVKILEQFEYKENEGFKGYKIIKKKKPV